MNNPEYFYSICVVCGILGGSIAGALMCAYEYFVDRTIKKETNKPIRHIRIIQDAKKTTIRTY